MQSYVVPVSLLLILIVVGVVGIVIMSLLAELGGNAAIYAGAAAVIFLAAGTLILQSRAAS
ncbi:MAG TPA: hypothetical protein VFA78_08150 [Chloroflexota bacterium]|nr:hypothetical protein [Chloroflexota bacterium]